MSLLPDPPAGLYFSDMVDSWVQTASGILEEPYLGFESAADGASALLTAYDTSIRGGQDPVGNPVTSADIPTATELATEAFGGSGFNTLIEFQNGLNATFQAYWATATIGALVPFPPIVTMVSNVITFVPPIVFTIPYNPLSPPYPSVSFWINTLSVLLTTQAQGIQGLATGLTSGGATVSIPWTSYTPSN